METPTKGTFCARRNKKQVLSTQLPQSLDEEEGVWLSNASLQELLQALPKSPSIRKIREYSDSSSSESSPLEAAYVPRIRSRMSATSLPPVGVFWDIENCHVPNGVSALSVVQKIRETFFDGYREAEFVVVCDVTKENSQVIQELNAAQIDLVHVAATSKNAADEKLRQSLRRFAERHGSPSAVVLISSDVNFASDLSALRHRRKIRVILVYQQSASETLIVCSDEHHDFADLTRNLPQRAHGKGVVTSPLSADIRVTNLPEHSTNRLKSRLKLLSANCGGRVMSVTNEQAVLRFSNQELALRACARMDGEIVFGSKISVQPVGVNPEFSSGRLMSPQSVIGAFPYNRMPPTPTTWSNASAFQPPARWAPQSTSNFQQQPQQTGSFRSVQNSAPQQAPYKEQSYETSLSAVSAWFNPSMLPPPQLPAPLAMLPPMKQPMERRTRSPSPHYNTMSPMPIRLDADGSEAFQPIQPLMVDSQTGNNYVELQVSNLDHAIDMKDMRRRLLVAFKEHVMVLHVHVFLQSDGQMAARVRVPTRQDAQVAVASLQRHLVGNRRIRISISNQNNRPGSVSPSGQLIRAQVAALLKEVPSQRLPLFQLCELFEKRYLSTVSQSELNRMKDILSITEETGGGRVVSLVPESRRSNTPSFKDMVYAALQEGQFPELPYCPIHALGDSASAGWAEKTLQPLPNVIISLQSLTNGLYALLNSHNGALSLYSLPLCFEAEVRQLLVDERGVPLEHLVTWVKGVILTSSPNGGCAKMLTWGNQQTYQPPPSSTTSEDSSGCEMDRAICPATLAAQVGLFGREVVELLRASPRCQISFIKFIPAYHHHFGRQCKVSNYGYTRLIDLLEALPNVVQVIGEGDARLVVLAQPAQIRRFTSDLLRVLKAQANKQAYVGELPELFAKCLGREFDPTEYGLNEVADLVSRVPKNTVVLAPPLGEDATPQQNTVLALPKREQTPEEVERTRFFASELVSLLRDAPQCSIPFNKFIPAYHHHFGHQCRLADYGVTKLAELLTAVSDVAQVEEVPGSDRRIVLALPERQRVLGEQVQALVLSAPGSTLLLSQLSSTYQHQHGLALDPTSYGAATTFELMQRLSAWIQVAPSDQGPVLQPVQNKPNLSLNVLTLLTKPPGHKLSLSELLGQLEAKFHQQVRVSDLKMLQHMLRVNQGEVALTPLYAMAARIRSVLQEQGGSVLLGSLASLYYVNWGEAMNVAKLGHASQAALLGELRDLFTVSGKGKKRSVYLVENLQQNTQSEGVSTSTRAGHEAPQSTRATLSGGSNSSTGSDGRMVSAWNHLLPTSSTQQHQQPSQTDENIWSVSTPIKLWSPPKCMPVITAPDPSELPMPPASLLGSHEEPVMAPLDATPVAHNLSDSGFGCQASPASPQPPRRRNRLAAHFSSPIELL